VKVVLTDGSVGLGLTFRLTSSADEILTVTEAMAVTVRESVAVTFAVKVP
jgi:hypothetical protein